MSAVTLADIERAVANHYGLSRADLKQKTHKRNVSWPRFIVLHLARRFTAFSTTRLGELYGFRDHTPIVYAQRRALELAAGSAQFRADLSAIEQQLAWAPGETSRMRRLSTQLYSALFPIWPPRDPFDQATQLHLFGERA